MTPVSVAWLLAVSSVDSMHYLAELTAIGLLVVCSLTECGTQTDPHTPLSKPGTASSRRSASGPSGTIRALPSSTQTTGAPSTTTPRTTTTGTTTPNPNRKKTLCYPVVGCFDNFPPFDNAQYRLPVSPDIMQTGFWLYTKQNNEELNYDVIDYMDKNSVKLSHFDFKRPTKVIVPGIYRESNDTWVQNLRIEFLRKFDFNILLVDWAEIAGFPDYHQAAANVRMVATQLTLVIHMLIQEGLELKDLHLIGYSLGAHISGYAGRLMGGKIARISGLDPAEPDFESFSKIVKLDPSDAVFVDVVHSNAGTLGFRSTAGHVDFYLNGGENQPGCPTKHPAADSPATSLFGDKQTGVTCSHARAHDVYVESIATTCSFSAYPCSDYSAFQKGRCLACVRGDCSQFGYYADQYHARGSLYLNTAHTPPFCGYHYAVTINTGSNVKSTKGRLHVNIIGDWGETGYMSLTGDQKLTSGMSLTRMFVSAREVGDVRYVEVKYVKHGGFWLASGEDSFVVSNVKVTSGENGSSYLACLYGLTVKSEVPVKILASSTKTSC